MLLLLQHCVLGALHLQHAHVRIYLDGQGVTMELHAPVQPCGLMLAGGRSGWHMWARFGWLGR